MNGHNGEKLRELLRKAIGSVADPELKRDLWPQMLQRFDERATPVAWFDWALAALLAVWLLLFPEMIPVLLYNL